MMYADTLEISPDFTVEDIHKIRERNYEKTKHMSVQEKLIYYNTPRTDAEEKIGQLRVRNAVRGKGEENRSMPE